MYDGEEDEKQSISAAAASTNSGMTSYFGTFLYDERVVTSLRRVIEARSEEVLKAIPSAFLDHILAS